MRHLLKNLFLLTALCAGSAQAALVSSDWKTAGDNKATVDTQTGIEWLKLDNTKGYTFAKYKAGQYTELAGWRLPTLVEVQQLIATNFPGMTPSTQNAYDATRATNWFAAMGITDPAGARSGSMGYVLADNGWQVYQFGQAWNYGSFWNSVPWNETSSSQLYNSTSIYSGMFLVNDGGLTLSSKLNPLINQNNLAAPNQLPRYTSTAVAELITLNSATINLTYNGSDYSGFNYRINGGDIQSTTGNQINLSGLQSSSNYVIEYAAYNQNGTSTTWNQTSFTTEAAPTPTPVSAPFAFSALGLLALGLRRKTVR